MDELSDLFLRDPLFKLDDHPRYHGGFGDVWRAVHCNRFVAAKQLSQPQEQVIREILTWSKLKHAHILPLLGVIDESNSASVQQDLHLISPWMFFGTANQFLRKRPEADLSNILCGISAGLVYMHENNVVHGDIKGDNILISNYGVPYIADFGLSRLQETSAAATNTSRKGTLRWMARELLGHERVSPTAKSDVWAFGMTMLELDSGCYPYFTLADPAVVNAITNGVLPSVPENVSTRLHCPKVAREICELCWKFTPEGRPSMNYILERLQELERYEKSVRMSTLQGRRSTEVQDELCAHRIIPFESSITQSPRSTDHHLHAPTAAHPTAPPTAPPNSNVEGHAALHWAVFEWNHDAVESLLYRGVNVNFRAKGGSTPLHWASGAGYSNIVELLLNHGAELNCHDDGGSSPLHWAVCSGHNPIATLLLDRGAIVDAIDQQKATPLHFAAQFGDEVLARTLLQYGANVTLTDTWEYSAMMVALESGTSSCSFKWSHLQGRCKVDLEKSVKIGAPGEKHLSVLRVLLQHQVGHIDKSAFDFRGLVFAILIATATRNHALLRFLLEDGCKASGKSREGLLIPSQGMSATIAGSLDTLMIVAVSNKDHTAMSLLIGSGANTSSALDYAAAIGDEEAAKLLLTTKPDMEKKKFMPLYWASLGHLRVVQLLVEHGAKVSPPALLPLWELASDGPEEIMRYLLEHGADPNAMKPKHPYTPLDWAVAYGRLDMMKLLLDSGANPNATDRHPIPALHIATMIGNVDAADLLLQYGAHPDKLADVTVEPPVRGKYGGTSVSAVTIGAFERAIQHLGSPLHLAAASGSVGMISLLLRYKADPTTIDREGLTARQRAMANGHHEVAAILERYEKEWSSM